jgi:hypothetical protein
LFKTTWLGEEVLDPSSTLELLEEVGKKVREEKGTQFLNWQLLQKPGTSLAYAPVSKAENPRVIYLYLSPQMFVQPSYFLPVSFKCIGEKLTCF